MSKRDMSSLAHLKRREVWVRENLKSCLQLLYLSTERALKLLEDDVLPSSLGTQAAEVERLAGAVDELRRQREYMEAEQAQKEKDGAQEGKGDDQ